MSASRLACRPLRFTVAIVLALGLFARPGSVFAQDTPRDLQSLRDAAGASMVDGCVASITEPAIQVFLQRAKAAGREGVTEETARETLNSPKARAVSQQTCRCVLSQALARIQDAATPEAVQATLLQLRGQHLEDVVGKPADVRARCETRLANPPPLAADATWEKVGDWTDAQRYMDTASVKLLDGGKVKAWAKAIFATQKQWADGTRVGAIEVLSIFDCDARTNATVDSFAFFDPDLKQLVYQSETPEDDLKFQPTKSGGAGEALQAWACARRAGRK